MATRESRAPVRVSFDQFLASNDGVHAEWVRGEVRPVTPGNVAQARLTRLLLSIVQGWADAHGAGEAFGPPFTLRLDDQTAREPDVFFVRRENANRIHGTFVDGPADLVIEILSPSTRGIDRGEKFREYEAAGVIDYWMIDPLREQAEAVRLNDGRYASVDPGDPRTLRCDALPGMSIPVAWLWQKPLPTMSRVMQEWGIA